METERLDLERLARLDLVLARLRNLWHTEVSCLERVSVAGLTVTSYAVPLAVCALLVARTFDPAAYDALVVLLRSALPYLVIVLLVFALLSRRLIREAWAHVRLVRRSRMFALADGLLQERGRPEGSASARTLLRTGAPGLLAACLVWSAVARLRLPGVGDDAPGLAAFALAAIACVLFFYVQRECERLLDHVRRRIDLSREVLMLTRTLESARRTLVETRRPVVLSRQVALRLSDLDRLFVLGQEAAALLRAGHPGTPGALIAWDAGARARAEALPQAHRFALDDAVDFVSLEAAVYWQAVVQSTRPLPGRLQAGLDSRGISLDPDPGGASLVRLSVSAGASATLAFRTDPPDVVGTLRVLAVTASAGGGAGVTA